MKRHLAEETVIFVSILKWIIFAAFIAAIVGLSTTGFLKALSWGTEFSKSYSNFLFKNNYSYFFFLPLDRKSTRLNSSHSDRSRMPSSA